MTRMSNTDDEALAADLRRLRMFATSILSSVQKIEDAEIGDYWADEMDCLRGTVRDAIKDLEGADEFLSGLDEFITKGVE